MASDEDVKHQIGFVVRSIQWSYAVFWSETQPGILKWGNGFYNGEIKTKSKTQALEQNGEDVCMQRSDQLRELFESLAANPKAKKLHTALSPEDLSEPEWFYLVCMSFFFQAGHELPGKALKKAQHVWLCNAHLADDKVFGRSILAKTVACFPVPGGVVELGVTDKVAEDVALVQRIRNYLRDHNSMCLKGSDLISQKPSSSVENVCSELNILDAHLAYSMASTSELGFAELDDSFKADSFNQELALQTWQFISEDLNDYVCHNPEKITAFSQKLDHQSTHCQEYNEMDYSPLGNLHNQMHYQSVVSAILQTPVISSQHGNTKRASSFVSYKKGRCAGIIKSGDITRQRMLKMILTEVPKMPHSGLLEAVAKDDKNVALRENDDTGLREADDSVDMEFPEAKETELNHVLAERRRREKLKRRFLVLRSVVPVTTKVDKVSILDDTIKYLKELERRIGELESAQEAMTNTKSTNFRKCQDQENTETTSENYEQEESTNPKPSKEMRKAF